MKLIGGLFALSNISICSESAVLVSVDKTCIPLPKRTYKLISERLHSLDEYAALVSVSVAHLWSLLSKGFPLSSHQQLYSYCVNFQ